MKTTKQFIVEKYIDQSGIVYSNTVKEVQKMAYQLKQGAHKLSVAMYAGKGIDNFGKHQDLLAWTQGENTILVATKAAWNWHRQTEYQICYPYKLT